MQNGQKSVQEFDEICKSLTQQMKSGKSIESDEVQTIIKRHYEWLKNFWIPNKESYIGLGQGYISSEWNKTFELYDDKLAQYLADAMKIFAEKNLE
jgi:hypothetical protein